MPLTDRTPRRRRRREPPGAVLIAPTGARYFNQGGCVALTDPPCGSQASAMVACIEHACGSCDDPSCADEAESSYCARFAFDTQCSANETNDIVCYPSATLTTEQFIEQLLQTFCSH